MLATSENKRAGVRAAATPFLGLVRGSTAAVTSACDWRIEDLLSAERPLSLYPAVPPSDISRTRRLVRLALDQIGRRLTARLQGAGGARNRPWPLMLDAFPALGRLDVFETVLAFLAGYGAGRLSHRSVPQPDRQGLPRERPHSRQCHIRVAFASNAERTAERISDALGTATDQRAMRNHAGHRRARWLADAMVSRQETARPLLTPGEAMQLPPADELVLVSACGEFARRNSAIQGPPIIAAAGGGPCARPRLLP